MGQSAINGLGGGSDARSDEWTDNVEDPECEEFKLR